MELIIDPEFQRICPPLKEAERKLLEESILEKGCIDPILVWNNTIVDGHNRYRICREFNIPFDIQSIEFKDRADAKLWIVKNQIGRRNISAFQRCELVLPLEPEIRSNAKKRMQAGIRQSARGDTRSILAEMAGVSHGTMDMVKEILRRGDEETIRRARSGAISIHWAYRSLDGMPLMPKPNPAPDETHLIPKPEEHLDLKEADCLVNVLIRGINEGDASPNSILAALKRISLLLNAELRR